jgi:CheY-like chemotaxis protein
MNTPWRILVVEDNEDDAFFMRRSLKAAAPNATCDFVSDGQAALDYLRGTGAYAHRTQQPLPDVVFLDLKLPQVYGLDVLARVRANPQTAALRVIVLTSSGEERDRSAATALGIQGYLVKPPSSLLVAEALAKLPPAPNRAQSEPSPSPRHVEPPRPLQARPPS